MSNPNLATEAAQAPKYPFLRFNQRERKVLASVKDYVDAEVAGIAGSHRIVAAGTFTTLGGDAAEAITATGALSTDLAVVQIRTAGAVPRTVVAAAAATNAINVTMSGDPSTDHVLVWQILRAV
jgi:hypothetical protein